MAETRAPALKRELGLRDLTLFAIASIVGVRWIAAAAHAGPGSILLWVLAALLFMIPLSVAVAVLTGLHPEAGGMYVWTRADFGAWHGFLCFWIYWVGIAIWFPSAAMFYVSAAVYAAGPGYGWLANDRWFLVIASLIVIWIALGTNVVGLTAGKWITNAGALSAWVLLLLLAAIAALVWRRAGAATHFELVPRFNWDTVNFWASIAYALTGMEVVGMMGAEIRDPARNVKRAAWISSVFILLFYVGATVSLLIVMRPEKINELNGLAETAQAAAVVLRQGWLLQAVAVLTIVSAVGQFGGLGASVARMPFAAGVDGLLPRAFGKLHRRWGSPHLSIFIFGAIASLLLIAVQFGDTARAAYQTIVSLLVIAGFLPFLYVFASLWKAGRKLTAFSGLAITVLALVCAVAPTADITRVWVFELKLAAGTAAVIGSAWVIYSRSAGKVQSGK